MEHGKPEYLPELGARETARWKWPRQLCMTLGKPSVVLAGRRKQAGKFKHFPCSVGLQLNFPQVLLQVHGQRRHKVAQIFCLLYASMRQPAHLLSLKLCKAHKLLPLWLCPLQHTTESQGVFSVLVASWHSLSTSIVVISSCN